MITEQLLKSPDATLDYLIDWSGWRNGDTISSSTFTVPSGITKDSQMNTTSESLVWLSGGTIGTTYLLKNQITTAAGRTESRYFNIKVEAR